MTGTLLKPLARPVLRGAARRTGEWIVFTCVGIDSTNLDAVTPRVGVDLSRVRTPDEAVAFVMRHGPLGPLPDGLVRSEGTIRGETTLKKPVEIRESVQDVLEAAQHLRDLLFAALDARKASTGDSAARTRLARFSEAHNLDDWAVTSGHDSREMWVSRFLALALTDQIGRARPHVDAAAPGQFAIRLVSDTLLGYCYVSIARALAKTRLEICGACLGVFEVKDGRQKFCSPKCAARARFERFKERHAEKRLPRKGRKRR